ncbi:MAG: HDIG domain-containing protein [Verrucomicrobium sp.]|nr:HDIG domain-containing protein [Verrucomicrobium sp.]
MISWLQRKRLVSKGMACDKTRRDPGSVEWRLHLEHSVGMRAVICATYALFALACGSFFVDSEQTVTWMVQPPMLILLTLLILASSIILLTMDQREVWDSNSKLFLLLGAISFNLFTSKLFFIWLGFHQHVPMAKGVLLVPLAFAPLLITVLLGTRAGLYSVFVASLLTSLLVNQNFQLLTISLLVGFTAVFFSRNVRRRGDLIRAGVAIGIVSVVCALALGTLGGREMHALWEQAALAVGISLLTAMVVSSLLPIIETLFNITTNMSWVEMADLNHPLLRQLTLEAPGTYHHSLSVANLAEAGAAAVGANATLCRVMAYFHDIGKLTKPEYFSENAVTGESPHDALSPTMSSLIIISHVKEGIDLAVKHRLKKPILGAIREHHGTSYVYYFYRRAKQLAEDAKAGSEILNLPEDDVPEVPEENFRYPGPVPQSRETGLLMLADAIEGASRSMEKPTPQRIEDLVNDIVADRIARHQLDESGLSLKELRQASEAFIFTLKTMLHSRISYPKNESPLPPSSGSLQSAKRMSGGYEKPRATAPSLP